MTRTRLALLALTVVGVLAAVPAGLALAHDLRAPGVVLEPAAPR